MIASPAVRNLLALLYLTGLLVFADQAADLIATLVANQPTPGVANWRFGAFGLLVSRSSVLLVADVMLFTAAIGLGHRGTLRVLGGVHLIASALLLAGLGVFALDWLQVRRQVRPETLRAYDLAALRAGAIALLALITLGWAAIASLRATRTKRGKGGRREESAPLLTGAIRPDEGP